MILLFPTKSLPDNAAPKFSDAALVFSTHKPLNNSYCNFPIDDDYYEDDDDEDPDALKDPIYQIDLQVSHFASTQLSIAVNRCYIFISDNMQLNYFSFSFHVFLHRLI